MCGGKLVVIPFGKAYDTRARTDRSQLSFTGAAMQFNKKFAIAILEMFAAVVTVFLLVYSVAPTAPAYAATAGAHTAGSNPQTADATCNAVLAALDKKPLLPILFDEAMPQLGLPALKPHT